MTVIDPDSDKRQEDLENEASIRQGEKISFQAGLPSLPENLSTEEAALLNKALYFLRRTIFLKAVCILMEDGPEYTKTFTKVAALQVTAERKAANLLRKRCIGPSPICVEDLKKTKRLLKEARENAAKNLREIEGWDLLPKEVEI
jgi:hypothetical protein